MILELSNLIVPALMSTLFTGSLSRLFLFPLYGYRFGFIVFFSFLYSGRNIIPIKIFLFHSTYSFPNVKPNS
nr:MAG TPA: hypothetical protein [Caudoviricetes sp.]